MIEESNLNLHLMGKQVFCFIAETFFPVGCILWGHVTSNKNETVSCQNLWASNIAKSMMLG